MASILHEHFFESQIVRVDAVNKSRVIKSQINKNLVWLLHICELLRSYEKWKIKRAPGCMYLQPTTYAELSGDKIRSDAFAVFTLFQIVLFARLMSTQKKNESLEICILKLIHQTNEIQQNSY